MADRAADKVRQNEEPPMRDFRLAAIITLGVLAFWIGFFLAVQP